MTKKEFGYWKEHKDLLQKAGIIDFKFYAPCVTNHIYIIQDSNFGTPTPTVRYDTEYHHTSFYTVHYKIANIWLEDDRIFIKLQRKHDYYGERVLEQVVLDEAIVNSFERKNIKKLIFH